MKNNETIIKLVALDLDGTLLNSRKELPADFINWVNIHPAIKTVIASGRQYETIARDFISVKDKLIYVAENGGIVYEGSNIIYVNEIQKKDVLMCLKVINKIKGATPVVCGTKSAYTSPEGSRRQEIKMYYAHLLPSEDLYTASLEDSIVKISVFVDNRAAEHAMKQFAGIDCNIGISLSGDSWIDLSYRTTSKGAAVAAIQDKYSISRKESMAFGDYLNDVSLFEVCEESYCMENGHPELKKQAKHMTNSNDENGVMKILWNL